MRDIRLPRLLASTSRPRCSHSRMKSSSNPLIGRALTAEEVGFGFTPAVAGYPKSHLLLARAKPPVPPKKRASGGSDTLGRCPRLPPR